MVGIRSCVEWIENVIHANFTDILFKLVPLNFSLIVAPLIVARIYVSWVSKRSSSKNSILSKICSVKSCVS